MQAIMELTQKIAEDSEDINLHHKRRVTEIGSWIIRLYEATNQPDKAREWREKTAPARPADRGS
jgi:hypothetical protein